MRIRFLGGVRTVTGTCFHLEVPGLRALVDCGMVQGEDEERPSPERLFAFDPAGIDVLFLTHAHLDHTGLVPRLVRDGFRGEIITTSATADLIEIMLSDSAHIQENDAQWQSKKALRAGREPVLPLYTVQDVKAAISLLRRVPYGERRQLSKGIEYRFVDAGHILGSGSLELWFRSGTAEKKIVFSGDIGKTGNPIIKDPTTVAGADYVVMESTYGNRLHKSMEDTIDELVDAIKDTFKKGGNAIIPAFAIGRTQDILYVLNRLVREGRLHDITVYIDSPLAEEATKTYLAHPECFDEEAKKLLSTSGGRSSIKLRFTGSVEESIALNKIRSQAVIIAGSGMCEGGRIRHHLKHNLWRPECTIIFSGFQARGTLGRRIVDGAKTVRIFGEEIAVRAKVSTIGGFSAHADQKGLLDWLAAFKNSPVVFLVHGEEETSLLFADIVRKRYGFTTHVPERGESHDL